MPLPDRFRQLWRDLVRVGPHADAHWVALRAGLSLAVPLLVLWGVDRLDLALAATFGAFPSIYGRLHGPRARTAMQASVAIVLVTAVAVGTAIATAEQRAWLSVGTIVVTAAVVTVVARGCSWHPPGALFAVFAVGAMAAHPATWSDVAVQTGVAAATALLALAIGRLPLLHGPEQQQAWHVHLRDAAASTGGRVAAGLTATATGLSAALATWLDLGHPYWAAVAAAAATSGATAHARVVRGVQRSAGTIVGVGIAAALLVPGLSALATVAVAVVLQMVAELLVGRNYALGLLAITPLALLMVHLAVPLDTETLVVDRVTETVLGTVIGIAVVVLVAADGRRRRAR